MTSGRSIPLGYVPALQLPDGTVMTEGPAIVQYIADQVADKQLAPANGERRERYELQSLLNFISAELHKSFSPLFNPNLSDDAKEVFRGKILDRFKWVDQQLDGQGLAARQAIQRRRRLPVHHQQLGQADGYDLGGLGNLPRFASAWASGPASRLRWPRKV